MMNPPRNGAAYRTPKIENPAMNTWIIIEKRKNGMNMQTPSKKRSQNLTFLLIVSPLDRYTNQLLRLVLRQCTHKKGCVVILLEVLRPLYEFAQFHS